MKFSYGLCRISENHAVLCNNATYTYVVEIALTNLEILRFCHNLCNYLANFFVYEIFATTAQMTSYISTFHSFFYI